MIVFKDKGESNLEKNHVIILIALCIFGEIGLLSLYILDPSLILIGKYNKVLPLLPPIFIYIIWLKFKGKI